ncbi:prephenate dehydrogenase [Thermoplasmatales archaeon]|nr:prephenate dehydrogenase [Thermoplasmatales archaeon]
MRIIVLGSGGRLGRLLSTMFRENGHTVVGIDMDNSDMLEPEIRSSDIVFLAVPVRVAIKVIKNYHSTALLVEMSSVKEPFREFRDGIISIHPLFGPLSVGDPALRNILFISDISVQGTLDMLKDLFPGFNIFPMSAQQHDEMAIQLQVIPYIISILSSRSIQDTIVSTRSKNTLAKLAEVSELQSEIVMRDTIRLNPFSGKAYATIREILADMGGEFLDRDSS